MTFLSILGLLVGIFGLINWIFGKSLRESNNFFKFFTKRFSIGLTIGGFFFFILNGLFFYAKPGTAYAVQYLWGGDQPIYTQGIKLKFWGRVIPMSYEIPVQDIVVKRDSSGSILEDLPDNEDKDIYYRSASQWEFNDAIKADIGVAVIVGIDVGNDNVFLNMADRNKTEDKLVYARIMPNIDAALRNTCKLISAQDYISGASADFDRYFRDQLENGTYQTEEFYEEEQTPEIIGDSTTIRTVKRGNSTKQKKFRIKIKNGTIIRDNSNNLKQYGLTILQAQVTDIDWENSFDERLKLQKEQVAQTQLEKQEAEKEFYRTQKEIAKAEAEKAKERGKLEKEQIQKTINAETAAKVAAFKVKEEKELLDAARLVAIKTKVEAEAESEKNRKLVSAGLTPQEKAEWDYKKAVGVAEKLAGPQGIVFPSTYVNGGGGKDGASSKDDILTLIMLQMMGQQNTKK